MRKTVSSLALFSILLVGCESQPKVQSVCEFEAKSSSDGTGLSKEQTAKIIEATRKRKSISLKIDFPSEADISYNAEYYFSPSAITIQNQQVIAESPVLKKLPGQREWQVKVELVGTVILIVSTDGSIKRILTQPSSDPDLEIQTSDLRLPVTWCIQN